MKPNSVKINYISRYDDVIVDREDLVLPKEPEELPAFIQRLTSSTQTILRRVPIMAFLAVFIPIGSTLFLMNSVVQSFRSSQRIRLHEEGQASINFRRYRIPLMINAIHQEVEDMFENVNNAQG